MQIKKLFRFTYQILLKLCDSIFLFLLKIFKIHSDGASKNAIIATGKIGDTILFLSILKRYETSQLTIFCDEGLYSYLLKRTNANIEKINRRKFLRNPIYRYYHAFGISRFQTVVCPGSYWNAHAEGFMEKLTNAQVIKVSKRPSEHELYRITRSLDMLNLEKVGSTKNVTQENSFENVVGITDGLVIAPGASDKRRSLEPQMLAEYVANEFSDFTKIYILGSKDQYSELISLQNELLEKDFQPEVYCNLQLDKVEELLASSKSYIGADSGLSHLAAALGIDTYVFAAGGHWEQFFPYPPHYKNVVTYSSQMQSCFKCNHKCRFPLRQSRFKCVIDAQLDWTKS